MVKILKIDASGKVPCPEVENTAISKLRGLRTVGGFSLAGKFPELSFVMLDGDECPPGVVDYFRVGLLNVFSSRLKSIRENGGAEMEYFPATVIYHKITYQSYFVGNPLKRFKAIDSTKSDFLFDEELGIATSVNKLSIDESKFRSTKLAVIEEIQNIGIADDLASSIASSDCIGCILADPATIKY